MKHKYVRHSTLGVVFFPADTELTHGNIGFVLRQARGKIVSAGFVWIERYGVVVTGRSESLGIGQAPDDADVIRNQLGYFSQEKNQIIATTKAEKE